MFGLDVRWVVLVVVGAAVVGLFFAWDTVFGRDEFRGRWAWGKGECDVAYRDLGGGYMQHWVKVAPQGFQRWQDAVRLEVTVEERDGRRLVMFDYPKIPMTEVFEYVRPGVLSFVEQRRGDSVNPISAEAKGRELVRCD